MLTILDSSCWLEILGGSEKGGRYVTVAGDSANLIVPSITIYEVYKRVLSFGGEEQALNAALMMRRGRVVDLDDELAVSAARYSLEHRLPMADAVIYATAKRFQATLVTFDAHFKGLPGVEYEGN